MGGIREGNKMITLDSTPKLKAHVKYEHEFTGLSTDTKPTGTYEGKGIANGSSFFMLDTQEISFYDEGSDAWK